MPEWLHARRLDSDLEDELAFHLAMQKEHGPEGRRLGNPTALKESLRDAWTFPAIESVWQDIRQGAREGAGLHASGLDPQRARG